MLVKIDVTQDDITNGRQCNCVECPVARAVNRTYPFNRGQWRVGVLTVYVAGRAAADQGFKAAHVVKKYALLPSEAMDFIRLFDVGLPVQPFQFELEIKEEELADFR